MFYVSSVAGTQLPYDSLTFRSAREASEATRTRALELEAQNIEAAAEDLASATSRSIRSGEVAPGTASPPGIAAAPGTISQAGASVLQRGDESGQAGQDSMAAGEASKRPASAPGEAPIGMVTSSRVVQQQEEHEEKDRPRRSPRIVNPYERIDQEQPEREPALTAQQIMSSPVVTLSPEHTLAEAWKLITERRFRHVPVVSGEGKLVGVISDRDFISFAPALAQEHAAKTATPGKPVRDFMATNVLSARPETEIRSIARVLFEERIGAMPIVDQNEKLVGLLTRSDILRTVVNKAPLQLWT